MSELTTTSITFESIQETTYDKTELGSQVAVSQKVLIEVDIEKQKDGYFWLDTIGRLETTYGVSIEEVLRILKRRYPHVTPDLKQYIRDCRKTGRSRDEVVHQIKDIIDRLSLPQAWKDQLIKE